MASAKDFANLKYISLVTFRKSGVAVPTPVWLIEEGGLIYIRTDPKSGKAKRIRGTPKVQIAPSDMRGKTLGPYVDGEAHFVEGNDAVRIGTLIKSRYGASGRLVDFVNGLRGRHATAVISIKV